MVSARWRLALAGAVLLAALMGQAAEAPPSSEPKMPREPDRPAPVEEPRPAPTVLLTQKEYQDLLDRIARLEGATRPETPSSCKIVGRVAGDLARLHVEFEFRTTGRRTNVALGCAQAFPTEAKIDGHPPILRWRGAGGLSVLVEEAGDHQLVLEMDLPLAARDKGGERGLDLDLPAAATTTLDLELPAGVKQALVRPTLRNAGTGKPAAVQAFRTDAGNPPRVKTPGLGPVERLEVTWEGQTPAAGPPLLSVSHSRIVVQVDDGGVTTDADLTLEVRRGQIKDAVQLVVPPQAVIRGIEGDDRVTPSDKPDPKGGARTVQVKPTADPLPLTIHLRQPRAQGAAPIPIGPFLVQGAFPQAGEILLRAPMDLTLDYEAKAESQYRLIRREPTDEERRQFGNVRLALHYSTLPGANANPPPFLGLVATRHEGVLEAKVTHTLRLVPEFGGQPSAWRILTTIEPQAHNNEPETLVVQLPPLEDYVFDRNYGVQPAGDVDAEFTPDQLRHAGVAGSLAQMAGEADLRGAIHRRGGERGAAGGHAARPAESESGHSGGCRRPAARPGTGATPPGALVGRWRGGRSEQADLDVRPLAGPVRAGLAAVSPGAAGQQCGAADNPRAASQRQAPLLAAPGSAPPGTTAAPRPGRGHRSDCRRDG